MRGSAAFRVAVAPGGALAGPWVRNSLWTAARAVPSLDLRFADNKSLVDAVTGAQLVTFTRASSGTFVGSDGVLRSAVTNLLLRSEEFDNVYWEKQSGTTVTANQAVAPDGTTSADLAQGNGSLGLFSGAVSVSTTLNNTKSVWMRSVTGTATVLLKDAQQTLGSTTCVLTTSWQRFSLVETQSGGIARLWIDDIPAGGIYLWGAQLEQSSTVGEYIPTTSTINSAPRFDHNPTTGESLGLLVEEARTNVLLNSATLSTQSVTVAAAANTLSFYGTGTVTLTGVSTAGPLVGTGANNRVSLTFTPTVGVLILTVSGSVTNAQLEAGAFATSYIPTVAATVTRAADVASITGTNFSSWYNQTEGTVFMGYLPIGLRTSYPLSIDDGTTNNFIGFGFDSGANRFARIDTGGVTQASITQGLVSVGSESKGALAFAINNVAASFNGTVPTADTSATIPTVDRVRLHALGGSTTFAFNGTIKRLVYWGQRLPNLQAIAQ